MSQKDFPPLQNDLILRAARGQQVEKVPVWVMRQAGKYLPEYQEIKAKHGFLKLCKTPELCCEVTLQPIKRFDLDAAIIFSDILFLPEAMGLELEMVPGKGPTFPKPIKTPEDLSRIDPNVDVRVKMKFLLDAIALTRQKLEGKCPLFGFSGAPWTLMSYMIEGEGSKEMKDARRWLYVHPDESHKLLACISEVIIRCLVEQVTAGAQILQLFDSHAHILGPDLHSAFSIPYLSKIAKGTKDQTAHRGLTSVPLVLYTPAASFALQDLSNVGFDVVHVDFKIDPQEARKLSKDLVALQGNLDPCALYANEVELSSMVENMISKFGTAAYIANLGSGIQPDTDVNRMEAFVRFVHDHSQKIIHDTDNWHRKTSSLKAGRKTRKIRQFLAKLCCLSTPPK